MKWKIKNGDFTMLRFRFARRPAAAFAAIATVLTAAFVPVRATSAELKPIKVSYQVSFWALPFVLAKEKGWWAEAGLNPSFSVFPAGTQQIAAAASGSWDVGGTGSVPAVLGAKRYGILTIGLTNDESATNGVLARKADADAIRANPALLKGKLFLEHPNSNAEYVALACLKKWGLKTSDVQMMPLAPAQLISAFTGNNGYVAATWSPNTHTLNQKTDAQMICNGAQANAHIPGTLVARADFAKQNPQLVAAFLAVYLRAVDYLKSHPDEYATELDKFFSANGVKLDRRYLVSDIQNRPIFTLDEQLQKFDRASGASTVDQWMTQLSDYLKDAGTISNVPDPKTYIDDTYLKQVKNTQALQQFVNR
jgi:NitT/TauT family transport system substrate-binding protein